MHTNSARQALRPRRKAGSGTPNQLDHQREIPPRAVCPRLLACAALGSLCYWAALPPLGWALLGWVAPVPWLWLARQSRLSGRRPYLVLYLAGAAFWLAAVHWLRLPHWATTFGWLALSLYLGVYLPLFVALVRTAWHRLRIPLPAAAPVAWAGLEYAQAHLLTGFSMASLPHSQYRWPLVLQICDLGGQYVLSFAMVLVASCVAAVLPDRDALTTKPRRLRLIKGTWLHLLTLGCTLTAVFAYGAYRLQQEAGVPGPRVALIQGSIDSEFKYDPRRQMQIMEQYLELSRRARQHRPDLLVWPETMCRNPLWSVAADAQAPSQFSGTLRELRREARATRAALEGLAAALGTPLIVGVDVYHFGRERVSHYNAAAYVDATGKLQPWYAKRHLVMFGEYVPLAGTFPWLYRLTPLPGGLEAGRALPIWRMGQAVFCPNVCFESCLPHVVRRQVEELCRQGAEPDVLLNLTNDGWFWGSSELDMHLACNVFRAVECRKPHLVAANTGISAWIDGSGRILARGPRRATAVLMADVQLDGRGSPYLWWGDAPAALCLCCCAVLALVGLWPRFRSRLRRSPQPSAVEPAPPCGPDSRTSAAHGGIQGGAARH